MRILFEELGLGCKCFGLALFALLLVSANAPVTAAPEGSRFNAQYFTNAPLLTHTGKTLRFYDDLIKDKIVVINFVYLSCNDICPLSTARLAEVKTQLGDRVGRDVFFLTITMDPEHDTPELLKEYAEAFDVGEGWYFLTGSPENLKRIRWRLGERSRTLAEHRNHITLGNERTGEWSRSSIYDDIQKVVSTIQQLTPNWWDKPTGQLREYTDRQLRRVDDQPGQALYQKACAVCHSIGGGDRIGPDLKNISTRRDRDWLEEFMMAPNKMRASGDPLTLEISAKYKGVQMPNLSLEPNDVADLLDFITAESARDDAKAAKQKKSIEADRG